MWQPSFLVSDNLNESNAPSENTRRNVKFFSIKNSTVWQKLTTVTYFIYQCSQLQFENANNNIGTGRCGLSGFQTSLNFLPQWIAGESDKKIWLMKLTTNRYGVLIPLNEKSHSEKTNRQHRGIIPGKTVAKRVEN